MAVTQVKKLFYGHILDSRIPRLIEDGLKMGILIQIPEWYRGLR